MIYKIPNMFQDGAERLYVLLNDNNFLLTALRNLYDFQSSCKWTIKLIVSPQ